MCKDHWERECLTCVPTSLQRDSGPAAGMGRPTEHVSASSGNILCSSLISRAVSKNVTNQEKNYFFHNSNKLKLVLQSLVLSSTFVHLKLSVCFF